MENTLERSQPVSTFVPYALLVMALVFIFVNALNKVELQPFETEYPAEAFLAPSFELSSLAGGKVTIRGGAGSFIDGEIQIGDADTNLIHIGASGISMGFYDATEVIQPLHIVDADGTLGDITTKFNQLLADIAALGLQAAT